MKTVGSLAGKAALQVFKTSASAALGIPFATSGGTAVATPQALGPINVSAPAANGYIRQTSSASMRSTGKGNMIVTHREYIQDIVPDTETNNNVFQVLVSENINPGNQLLFPWLSAIATRFETYQFRALRFIYEPQCATTSVGTMSQVIDYDALDDAPQTKLQMMAYKGAVRSPPWFCSQFNAAAQDLRKMKEYYVRNTAQQGGGDARVYDVGNYFLAYEGPADNAGAAGELYIEYTVELKTPNLQPFVLSGQSLNQGTDVAGGYVVPSNGQAVSTQGPLTVSVVGSTADNGFLVGSSAPGTYLMVVTVDCFGLAAGADDVGFSAPTGSNATVDVPSIYATELQSGEAGYMTTWAPVNFPTTEDLLLLTKIQTWASSNVMTLRVQLLPLSQETFSFPTVNNPAVLPLAIRRGMRKLARYDELVEHRSKKEAEIVDDIARYRVSRKRVDCSPGCGVVANQKVINGGNSTRPTSRPTGNRDLSSRLSQNSK